MEKEIEKDKKESKKLGAKIDDLDSALNGLLESLSGSIGKLFEGAGNVLERWQSIWITLVVLLLFKLFYLLVMTIIKMSLLW